MQAVSLRRSTSSSRCTLQELPSNCDATTKTAEDGHVHGEDCGHERIQHGDHVDYVVPNSQGQLELHHIHILADGSSHTDIHGVVSSVPTVSSPLLTKTTPGGTRLRPAVWRFRVDVGPMASIFRVGAASPTTTKYETAIAMPEDKGLEPVETVLCVEGICCPSEVPLIESILGPLPGVREVKVNVPARTTHVVHLPGLTKPEALAHALNGASLGAFVQKDINNNAETPLPNWNVILCGVLWIVSLLHYAHGSWEVFEHFKYIALGSIALGLPPILLKAYGSATRYVLDINCLMSLAVCGAIGIGDYAEGAAVVFLFAISEYLETRSSEKARHAIASVMSLKPEMAELSPNGESVHVDQVPVATILQVRPGEKVPIDGIVVKGASSVDESSLTGEARPIHKAKGDTVLAGTINQSGYLEMETTALAKDSAAARLVQLVADAQTKRSPTEVTVAEFAKWYTPVMVLGALLMATVPWATGSPEEARGWFRQALILLVVACPCALVISTPITYVCALACAAKRGILIKGGVFLEALGQLTCLALDKTGTLTLGSFQLTQLELLGEASREQFLYNLGSVEAMTSHPMAVALVAAMKKEGIQGSKDVDQYTTHPGEGVSATVDGHLVEVGNARFGSRVGWISELADAKMALALKWEKQGGTVGYVAVDGVLQGMFAVNDTPRKEAQAAMASLKSLGITTVMLTGDNQGSAEAIQEQVMVEEIHAGLKPQDKTEAVAALKLSYGAKAGSGAEGSIWNCYAQSGGVGMVGDGINDAPALAAADIGIAMGAAGTAVAMETADTVLMDSNLNKLVLAIELGRVCRQKIRENIALSVVTKVAMIGLTLAGHGSLWLAIVTDVGTMLLVTFNGMSVMGYGKQPEPSANGHSHSHGGGGGCCGHDDDSTETAKPTAAVTPAAGGCCSGHGHGAPAPSHGHGHGAQGHSGGCCDDHSAAPAVVIPAHSCCGGHGPAAPSHGHGEHHGDAQREEHGHSHGGAPCAGHGNGGSEGHNGGHGH